MHSLKLVWVVSEEVDKEFPDRLSVAWSVRRQRLIQTQQPNVLRQAESLLNQIQQA